MNNAKKVVVNMYRVPQAKVVTQYIGTDLPAPAGGILMNSNLELEIIPGSDEARLSLGQVVEGFRISLSLATLRTLL